MRKIFRSYRAIPCVADGDMSASHGEGNESKA